VGAWKTSISIDAASRLSHARCALFYEAGIGCIISDSRTSSKYCNTQDGTTINDGDAFWEPMWTLSVVEEKAPRKLSGPASVGGVCLCAALQDSRTTSSRLPITDRTALVE
jgi:hypothetical protein